MAHTLVIGGQPDRMQLSGTIFTVHGREITVGDAEKVLDLSPSVTYRAPSSFSGEFFFTIIPPGFPGDSVAPYGIVGITHNLMDIDAKARCHYSTNAPANHAPDSTVSQDNTTSTFTSVDESPYGTIADYATATATGSWHLEVGFSNSSTLYTGVADSQVIVVHLEVATGGTGAAGVTIEVKEGATVRESKSVQSDSLAEGDSILVNVLVDPTDFTNQTLDDMSVRVSTNENWKIGAIGWTRYLDSGVAHDTGWVLAETPTNDLFHMSENLPGTFVLPNLDSNGELVNVSGSENLRIDFTWDDSSTSDKPRIFASTFLGTLTSWRPEIGIIAAGPAYGTNRVPLPTISFGSKPNSLLFESKGGNTWSVRRQPRRVVSATMQGISGTDFIDDIYSVLRRADRTLPLCVAVDPSSASPNIRAAASIYGRLTSLRSTPRSAEGDSRHFDVSMSFEEVV